MILNLEWKYYYWKWAMYLECYEYKYECEHEHEVQILMTVFPILPIAILQYCAWKMIPMSVK